jgi:hypothetical protein
MALLQSAVFEAVVGEAVSVDLSQDPLISILPKDGP